MSIILIADDSKKDRERIRNILENYGYETILASNPDDALSVLKQIRVDAAILDYKLLDGSELDQTGLYVAQNSSPLIPKIMVSDKAGKDELIKTISTNRDGIPLILSFVDKDKYREDETHLLDEVKKALQTGRTWERQSRENLMVILSKQEKLIKWFDICHSFVHLVSAMVFIGLMITVVFHLHEGMITASLILIALLAAEITNVLLAKKGHSSSSRADNYHKELLQAYRYEQLLASCEGIENSTLRDQTKSELVRATSNSWLTEHIGENKIVS